MASASIKSTSTEMEFIGNINREKFDQEENLYENLYENKESAALFDAYNGPRDIHVAHDPRPEIYGAYPKARDGVFITSLPRGNISSKDGKRTVKKPLRIAYTVMGNKGPVWVFLHGVPMNRRMKFPIMRRMSRFCRVACFDLLGMGESSMPLDYNWNWETHAAYIPELIEYLLTKEFRLFSKTKVFFQTDDWGSGPGAKVASLKWAQTHLHAKVFLDPIAFSGYFIAEIGTMGRASQLPWGPGKDGTMFEGAVGTFDQQMVQIEKSMVRDTKVTNQWQQRDDLFPYVSTDYERNDSISLVGKMSDLRRLTSLLSITTPDIYTPLTRRLNMWNIRVLAQQAAYLRPASLQPYHRTKNPQGIEYDLITVPTMISWGEQDDMMPAGQVYHYKYAMRNSALRISMIPEAGHFAEKDQPDRIATEYLNYTEEILGLGSLAQPFLGLDGIWKGDEETRAAALKQIYPYKE
uniref:Haloalkane dehalogenase n=1 Tax=Pithovirus LCDPAC01 TaxID=2506600 RepID=A0A481YQ38_9VIRU|nr:MAG: haloalkane dehalogenase [Pithovirus LCDPAC01]